MQEILWQFTFNQSLWKTMNFKRRHQGFLLWQEPRMINSYGSCRPSLRKTSALPGCNFNQDPFHILSSKESACNAGDADSIPGSGRSPGEGNGSPLEYSCLGNPMDRGAWWTIVHRVTRVGRNLATRQPPPQLQCDLAQLPCKVLFSLLPGLKGVFPLVRV